MLSFSFAFYYYRVSPSGILLPNDYRAFREGGGSGLPFLGEFCVLLCFGVFLLARGPESVMRRGLDSVAKALFVLFAYGFVISHVDPYGVSHYAVRGALRGSLLIPTIGYLVAANVPQNPLMRAVLVAGFLAGATVQTAAVVAPGFFPKEMLWGVQGPEIATNPLTGENVLIESGRGLGFYERSTPAGVCLLLHIALAYGAMVAYRREIVRFLLSGLILFFCYAVAKTIQRNVAVALVAMVLMVLLDIPRRIRSSGFRATILLLLMTTVSFLAFPYVWGRFHGSLGEVYSNDYRSFLWPAYIGWLLENPMILVSGAGFGVSAFSRAGQDLGLAHGHNQILTYFGYVGVPMTCLFCSVVAVVALRAARALRDRSRKTSQLIWQRCMLLSVAAMGIMCIAEVPFNFSPAATLFFVFAGLSRGESLGRGRLALVPVRTEASLEKTS